MSAPDTRSLHICLTDETKGHAVQEWVEPLVETWLSDASVGEIFRALQKEYGRCTGKIYVEQTDRPDKSIGWFFVKQQQYEDTGGSYLCGAWVTITTSPCLHTNQHINDRSQFVCDDCGEELGR